MPAGPELQLPPPKDWGAFESLCHSLWKKKWDDIEAAKHGRQGQPQHGVDVYGRRGGKGGYHAVQCKGKDENYNSKLTLKELRAEVEKAKSFVPKIETFIIATTAANDGPIQEEARKLSDENEKAGLFSVSVRGWDDIQNDLYDFPEVIEKHYPQYGTSIRKTAETVEKIDRSAQSFQSEIRTHIADLKGVLTNGTDSHWDGKLDKQLNEDIDKIRKLQNEGSPAGALKLLLELKKTENYQTAKPAAKFRVETNIGAALAALGKYLEASEAFIRAADFDEISEKSRCNFVYAHILASNYRDAQRLAEACMSDFPESAIAASMWIYSHTQSSKLENPEKKINPNMMDDPEILHALSGFYRDKDYQKHSDFAWKLYQHDPKSLQGRLSYAESIMTPIFAERGLIHSKLIDYTNRRRLLEARQLFENVFSELVKSENKFNLTPVAINLATICRFLGDHKTALRFLDEAIRFANLQVELDDLNHQRIHVALGTENVTLGLDALAKIKRKLPERDFLEGIFKLLDGKYDIGIRKLEAAVASGIEFIVIDSLLNIAVAIQKTEGVKKAIQYLNQRKRKYANQPLFLCLLARLYHDAKDFENRDKAIGSAEELVKSNPSPYEAVEVADNLMRFDKLDEAARCFRLAIDGPSEHPAYEKFLLCLLHADKRKELRIELNSIDEELLSKPAIRKIHAIFYAQIGDLPEARKSFEEFIKQHGPNDADIYLHFAQTLKRIDDQKGLEDLLENPFPADASVRQRATHYQMLFQVGKIEQAFALAHIIYHSNYNSEIAHLGYVGLFVMANTDGVQLKFLSVDKVKVDTEVTYTNASGEKTSIIIENAAPSLKDKNIIAPESDLAKALLNKRIGDPVVLVQNEFREELGTVLQIRHKFLADYQNILDRFNLNFPASRKLITFTTTDGKSAEENFKPILSMLDRRYESTQEKLEHYKTLPVSLGLLAASLDSDVFRAYEVVREVPDVGFVCCAGTHEERQKAFAVDVKAGLILDPLTLYLVHRLQLQDIVLKAAPTGFAITQSCIDTFQKQLEELPEANSGFLAKTPTGYVWQDVTSEQKAEQKTFLEGIIVWAKQHCQLETAVPNEELPDLLYDILEDADTPSLDTIQAAHGTGRVMLCEDLRLRQYAETLGGVQCTWLQAFLINARNTKLISSADCNDAIVKLLVNRHNYVSVDANLLTHLFEKDGIIDNRSLDDALGYLGRQSTEINSCVSVVLVFLIQLWRKRLPIETKEAATFKVLNCMIYERWNLFWGIIEYVQQIMSHIDGVPNDAFVSTIIKWFQGHMIPFKEGIIGTSPTKRTRPRR